MTIPSELIEIELKQCRDHMAHTAIVLEAYSKAHRSEDLDAHARELHAASMCITSWMEAIRRPNAH